MKQKLPDLPLPAEIEGPKQVARRSDIDMNGHINNVTYLGWALETVPLDTFLTCKLHQASAALRVSRQPTHHVCHRPSGRFQRHAPSCAPGQPLQDFSQLQLCKVPVRLLGGLTCA